VTGARNRRHGHDAERMVAIYLRAHGWPDTETTRARLGHDGSRQPGDIAWRDDVCLEVKSRVGSSWPAWCAKAAADARPGQHWIVVRRVAGNRDVGTWPAAMGNGGPAFRTHSFANIIDRLT
jgi:hypothetical protein